jgi:hypothetical protein
MRKSFIPFGVACLGLCVSSVGAEAKLVRYEVNGQQYTYSTNNRQQTREARARIDAAKAAESAKARADTEAAANPLVMIFGSQTQRQATEAQARVQQAVGSGLAAPAPQAGASRQNGAPQPAATAAAQPEVSTTSSLRRSRPARERAGARREQTRPVRQASLARPDKADSDRESRQPILARPAKPEAGREPKETSPSPLPAPAATAAPEPARPVAVAPAVDSPTRAGPPPAAHAQPPGEAVRARDGGSLTDFVNQVRRAPGDAAPRL